MTHRLFSSGCWQGTLGLALLMALLGACSSAGLSRSSTSTAASNREPQLKRTSPIEEDQGGASRHEGVEDMGGKVSEGQPTASLPEPKFAPLRPHALQVGNEGTIFIVGDTEGAFEGQSHLGGQDAFLLALNAKDGSLLWARQFGTNARDVALSVAVDNSGNVFVVGSTDGALVGQSSLGRRDAFITKRSGIDGSEVWTRQFGSARMDSALSLALDSSGNAFVVGSTTGQLGKQSSAGEEDAFVYKFSGGEGRALWLQQFGTPSSEKAHDVVVDSSGHPLVLTDIEIDWGGDTDTYYQASPRISYVAKLRSYNGRRIWTEAFGFRNEALSMRMSGRKIALNPKRGDFLSHLTLDPRGDLLFGGSIGRTGGTCPSHDGQDPRVVKLSGQSRKQKWEQEAVVDPAGMSMFNSASSDIATNRAGDVYEAGYTSGASGDPLLNAYLRKLSNATGDVLFQVRYRSSQSDTPVLALSPDGDVFIGGEAVGGSAFDDIRVGYVARHSPDDGKLVWKKVLQSAFSDVPSAPEADDLVVFCGQVFERREVEVVCTDAEVKDLSPLRELPLLTYAHLTNTSATDFSSLASLSHLTSLDLKGTSIEDLSPLSHLRHLAHLDLGLTQVSDLRPLRSLTEMQSLHLGGAQVKSLSPLSRMVLLRELELFDLDIDDLSPLSGLTRLEELDLHNTKVSDLKPLAAMVQMRQLQLQWTPVSDIRPLSGLTKMSWIALRDTQIIDTTPLHSLAKLQTVYLPQGHLGERELSVLKKALPQTRFY